MNERVETVLVIMPNGPVMVNKSDYLENPDAYGPLADEGATVIEPITPAPGGDVPLPKLEGVGTVAPAPEATPVAPAPALVVEQRKKRFFVINTATGADAEGFDAAGYDSEANAWGAIMAIPAA